MFSIYSVLFTLVVFSEMSGHVVPVAVPANKLEDDILEQEDQTSMQGDEPMTERARRSLVLDNVRDEDGVPKIIVVSDMRLKGHSVRGLNPAFTRGLPLIADRTSSHTPAEYSLKVDRRDTDLDIMRCMIGRVYRPCWEA
ncbi:pro-MCH [Aulostomus maculatus]